MHQQFEPVAVLDGGVDHPLPVPRVGDVTRHGEHRRSGRLGDRPYAVGPPPGHRHARTGGRQPGDDRGADARPAARDQR